MRVRFCPSPSGAGMHLGNAKTALFNYLFAKKNNADFIMRIEDTDQSRVVNGGADQIFEDMRWLGIVPNMGYGTDNKPAGVYTQMERLPIYKKYVDQLLEKGLAYKCYCTQQELDAKREAALAVNPKAPFKYPGTCRHVKQDQDKPYVVRFKAPTEGSITFTDIAFGNKTFPNKENYDFVIMREDGSPLYNTAVVIDDGITDQITHVIRGSDHLKNQIQQILLYTALELPLPVFCHLPMLLSPAGGKLSKRDGSVSVAEYRKAGYSPNAVLNYLVRFGWGYGNQEIFSLSEMIEKFDINNVHCRDGKFDTKKFAITNAEHLKSDVLTSDAEYVKHVQPFLQERKINISDNDLTPFISVIRSRAKNFVEAADLLTPILTSSPASTELMIKTFNKLNVGYLKALNTVFCGIDGWNEETIRSNVNAWLSKENLALKDVGSVLRVALLGQTNSPEIFQVMNAMGKSQILNRLNNTLSVLEKISYS